MSVTSVLSCITASVTVSSRQLSVFSNDSLILYKLHLLLYEVLLVFKRGTWHTDRAVTRVDGRRAWAMVPAGVGRRDIFPAKIKVHVCYFVSEKNYLVTFHEVV